MTTLTSSSSPRVAVGSQPQQRAAASGPFVHHLYASVAATVALTVLCCGLYPLVVWGIAQAVFPQQANGSLLDRSGKPTTDATRAVASALIGQNFSAPQYFHPRPSSAGNGYDAANSCGSNLGPVSDKLLNGAVQKDDKGVESVAFDGIRLRTMKYAMENGVTFASSVPLDAALKDKDGNLDDIKLIKAFPHNDDPADKRPLVFSGFSRAIPVDAVTASGSGLDPHISPANAGIQLSRIAKVRNMDEAAVRSLIAECTDRATFGVIGEDGVNVVRLNLALDARYPLPATATRP